MSPKRKKRDKETEIVPTREQCLRKRVRRELSLVKGEGKRIHKTIYEVMMLTLRGLLPDSVVVENLSLICEYLYISPTINWICHILVNGQSHKHYVCASETSSGVGLGIIDVSTEGGLAIVYNTKAVMRLLDTASVRVFMGTSSLSDLMSSIRFPGRIISHHSTFSGVPFRSYRSVPTQDCRGCRYWFDYAIWDPLQPARPESHYDCTCEEIVCEFLP
jgi:hypothetical protein